MNIVRPPFRLLLALTAFVLSSCHAPGGSPKETEMMMNEQRTIGVAHCAGRHVVLLPQDAKVVGAYRVWGNLIELQAGMRPVEAGQWLSAREAILRASSHKKTSSLFNKRVELPGESQGLTLFKYADETEFQRFEFRFVSPPPSRVWKYEADVSEERLEVALPYYKRMAASLQSREPRDMPSRPGFCIEGGIVGDKEFQSEEYTVRVSFGSKPRVSMKFFSQVVNRPAEKLLDRASGGLATLSNLASSTRTLRRGDKAINGIAGQELLLSVSAEGQRGHYFRWESPGKAQSMEFPKVAIELSTMNEPDDSGNIADSIFKTDEEALKFWDAIVSTFRVRAGAV
jgi:hypothetical protein